MKYFLLRPFDLPQTWSDPAAVYMRLCDSLGSALADDVYAETDLPDYDTALRDGWAVRSGDAERQVLAGSVENGIRPEPLACGTALWINTGGMMPAGSDAVIPAASPLDEALCQSATEPGRHVLAKGAEWHAGDRILKKNTFIGASELALLLEAGIDRVKVFAPPEAGILSTGSELKELFCRGETGPLRVSSNACYLRALLLSAGVRHVHARSAPDDEDAIAERLTELARCSTFLFTIGGTGAGRRDLTRRAILRAGGKLYESTGVTHSVPPFIAGEIRGVPLLGLPGNPLGAMMIMQRAALPLIWKRFHAEDWRSEVVSAAFGADIAEPLTGDLCVSLERGPKGFTALPVVKGTGCSRLFREAGGVIRLRGETLRAGAQVLVERFFN